MKIEEMVGMVFDKVYADKEEDIIVFSNNDVKITMHHYKECCEYVSIEDICGDLNNLVGHPILMAEEETKEGDIEYGVETWTFYKFATVKGYVTIRWYGESNGYYSTDVELTKEKLHEKIK